MTEHIPALDEVRRFAADPRPAGETVVPIFREVLADLETPVSAYLKLARGPYSFLLESADGGERVGRYSFIGTEPYRVLRCEREDGDPLRAVEEELAGWRAVRVPGLPRFHGGAVGYIGYEAVSHFEPRVGSPECDALGVPESWLMFCDTLVVFDHLLHTMKVVAHVRLDGDVGEAYRSAQARIDELVGRLEQPLSSLPDTPLAGPYGEAPVSNWTRPDFLDAVRRTREYIEAGDAIQVVLSQRYSRRTGAHPFEVYRSLRAINPSPYMYFVRFGDDYLVGASPELLVKIEDGRVENHPIAGTRRRGASAGEDRRLGEELLADPKERAEHVMLLDLARNDVGRVAEVGSVQVTQRFALEHYSHVIHMASHVEGRLRAGLSPYDALRASFPAGTVSGAPKIRAMEIIAELEPDRRGPYAGAVGFFDMSGNVETCITIRTVLMRDGVAHVQAGAGLVYDSVPEREFEETEHKARALIAAIDDAEKRARRVIPGSLGY